LTQFGMDAVGRPVFRSAPRLDLEVELSLLLGQLSVEDAARYVLLRGAPQKELTAAQLEVSHVRYCLAGDLRDVGLAVVHTQSRVKSSVEHVSLVWPDEAPIERQTVPWPPDVSASFERCFNEA
jgi:hypothetical protein